MRYVFVACVISFVIPAFAQDKAPSHADRLDAWVAKWQEAKVEELKHDLEQAKTRLAKTKSGEIGSVGRDRRGSIAIVGAEIRSISTALAKAKHGQFPSVTPPFIDVRTAKQGNAGLIIHPGRPPRIHIGPARMATRGSAEAYQSIAEAMSRASDHPAYQGLPVSVLDVSGPEEMLVSSRDRLLWISGVSTVGLQAGSELRLNQIFEVAGTKTTGQGGESALRLECLGKLP